MEVLGHSVVMLHPDQELVLVQLFKTVQSRRFDRYVGETWSKNQSSDPEQN